MGILGQLIILIVVTFIMGRIGQKLGFAEVVGQLIAGIIIGPALLHWVTTGEIVSFLSELGVLLLMFTAGLETDIGQLKRNLNGATLTAIMGVVVPLILFTVVALVLGYQFNISIFWGIVFAATSISITISVLGESGQLGSQVGAVVLGAAVLDDMLALLLVGAYVLVFGGQGLSLSTLLPIVVFILGLVADRLPNSGKILKFTNLLGTWTLFPIFFGSIGLHISLNGLQKTWPLIVVLTVLAVATKYYGAQWGARLAKLDKPAARAVGAGMVSRGEMALVVAQIGLSADLIAKNIFGDMVFVIIISTIIAPLLLRPLLKRV
ncbi:cation:proton antiporter [Weissella paramesenteroides]|jgi:Kef-type K+ transport system membrane component KefB|uniref:cation:proton antiporter n=1 Tax=Weissella paramesenteroides TaxID=1249 RepID=UPI002E7AF96C|nr:cation:proton antiporter [Weissella paramesenteroides]WPQ68809.1 cation:proton antiporter [Weissella paramesenteroides]